MRARDRQSVWQLSHSSEGHEGLLVHQPIFRKESPWWLFSLVARTCYSLILPYYYSLIALHHCSLIVSTVYSLIVHK